MQYQIRIVVSATDRRDDMEDAYFEFNADWENVIDAVTDAAHAIDGTRPNPDATTRMVFPAAMHSRNVLRTEHSGDLIWDSLIAGDSKTASERIREARNES